MSSRMETLQRYLDKAVVYNIALAFLAIALFGGWLYADQLPKTYEDSSEELAFLEQLSVDDSISIDLKTVTSTTRGKSVFRTARVMQVKTVDALGRFELMGTSIRGEERKAYIRDTKMKKLHTVKPGEEFGGVFKVLEIERNAITVQRGNEMMKLEK